MSQDQEAARLRECLRYIRIALRNNAASTQDICATIDRAIGSDAVVMTSSGSMPNSFGGGGGGASMEGIPQDPTNPSLYIAGGGGCVLPGNHTGPCRPG